MEAQQKIAASPLGQEMKDGDLVMPESNLGSGESASRTTPKSGKSNLGAKSKRKGRWCTWWYANMFSPWQSAILKTLCILI